ncbi:5-carboxymethyl-2-hydroxymuconate Delta-isomerase [Streptomyces sp. NBC_01420]|uniref:5-carboxymethyl-2-hydroxymuconate Delta-isomerase n=1 Tax=Streptomyces sp. NBC_01420 TaxID=2903858 RepID=UPI003254319B
MPQITVDYSAELGDAFDRPAFALALHPVVAETVDTKIAACKTRFRRAEETVVADAPDGDALVHVDISLLPGRTPETKARLTEAVLELLRAHLGTADGGTTLHLSAEVRDLDASYRKV